MALKPLIYQDPLYQLLREGNVQELNQRKTQGEKLDLTSCDFDHLDLCGLAAGVTFTDVIFALPICAAISQKRAQRAPPSMGQGSPAPSGPSRPTASKRLA